MLLGTATMAAALGALVVALAASISDLLRPEAQRQRMARRATYTSAGLLFGALLLLAYSMLARDLSVHYVWAHSDIRHDWAQRLSGVWVGREGSLLLWTSLIVVFWAAEELRHRASLARDPSGHHAWTDATSADNHIPRAASHARTQPPAPIAQHAPRDDPAATHDKTATNDPTPTEDRAPLAAQVEGIEGLRRIARPLILSLATLLVGVLLTMDLFGATSAADLRAEPFGRGVNPQLLTLYNTIHPPIVLTGYALTVIPTALATAHLLTGHTGWIGPARRWSHTAFLFLTAGIFLGALWAYIALGWGGYWAWDPVEVGILVPWLANVAFLHAGMRHDRNGTFPTAAPALAFLMFPAAIFSTIIVRAGGVWVSVHSFLGAGDAEDAWGRFVASLESLEVQLYALLLGLAIVSALPLLLRHVNRLEAAEATARKPDDATPLGMSSEPQEPRPPAEDLRPARANENRPTPGARIAALVRRHATLSGAFNLGVILLTLLATVIVTLLIVGIDGFPSNQVRESLYTTRTAPLALAGVTVMSFAIGIGTLPRNTSLALHVGALAAGGLVGWVAFPGHAALTMASFVLVLAASMAMMRIIRAARSMPLATGSAPTLERQRRVSGRLVATHLVHLGVIVTLLGHGFVNEFASNEEVLEFALGDTRTVQGTTITLDRITTLDLDDDTRFDIVRATFSVQDNAETPRTVTIAFEHFEQTDHYKPFVGIERTLTRDLYLAPRGIHDPNLDAWVYSNLPLFQQGAREVSGADGISIGVSTLPYINLVWSGAGLMVLGSLALATLSWRRPLFIEPTSRTRPSDIPRTQPAPKGPEPAVGARPSADVAATPGPYGARGPARPNEP